MSEEKSARGKALQDARQKKLDNAFQGRHFTIVKTVHLEPGKVFATQFGNRGRHGFVIRDDETGETQVVGKTVLNIIAREYNGVDLPEKKRRKSKAAASAEGPVEIVVF